MADLSAIRTHFTDPPEKNLTLSTLLSDVAGLLLILGYICAVVMIFYIAIRYFVAKPAEKAHLKTQLIYLFAGAMLLASGTTILGVVAGVFKNWF